MRQGPRERFQEPMKVEATEITIENIKLEDESLWNTYSDSPCDIEIKCTAEAKPKELVDHPSHYNGNQSGIECIDVIEHMSFNVGNAIKYLWRHEQKGGGTDLLKAIWYIIRELKREYGIEKILVDPPEEEILATGGKCSYIRVDEVAEEDIVGNS